MIINFWLFSEDTAIVEPPRGKGNSVNPNNSLILLAPTLDTLNTSPSLTINKLADLYDGMLYISSPSARAIPLFIVYIVPDDLALNDIL